jgi:hypothetical protein
METQNHLWRFRMVSLFIVVVLGLQSFAVIARTAKGWPFTDYPMYATSHQDGDRVPVESNLYATFDDATEVLVTPNDLGIGDGWWTYNFWILSALQAKPVQGSIVNSWRATFVDPGKLPSWVIGDRKSPERAVAFVLERYDKCSIKGSWGFGS